MIITMIKQISKHNIDYNNNRWKKYKEMKLNKILIKTIDKFIFFNIFNIFSKFFDFYLIFFFIYKTLSFFIDYHVKKFVYKTNAKDLS